ncbi:DUF3313 domain-containing protein [Mangrovibacter plantisponsor]|uniref:Uncharacterized protein DUF3313 n=1 Tax=Mangrovibacter plantisponsor TaxID=451513 RepID=A0A317PUE3_9ENTR|nr:DUF3313 domain-containing protein [Mangrovibacter plantisponsor]PWW05876.1 uncharacterized protein DUF3313 [Mangrovibacter plantisponsor]
MTSFVIKNSVHLAVLTGIIITAGCTSTAPTRYSGVESSYEMTPNTDKNSDTIPFHYAPTVDWKKYDQIIIDPVDLYQGSDGQFNDMSVDDRKQLADYMQKTFTNTLSKRFTLTHTPSANTLHLKLTLTGADTTPQVIGTFTKFDLAGGPYNIVQSVRGKRGLMSGYVNYAVEVYDSKTDERLLAYVAEQYPNAMNIGATFGSLSAAKTGIDKGADELLKML